MNTAIEDDSTLTDRYQTTIPASVRRALKLNRRDRIHYMIRPNGEVVLTRARDESTQDPVMTSFLAFLERDLQGHPENIHPVTASTFAKAESLTAGIEVDLDEELPEDDDDT
ncbi:antitoxin PrlF [Vreelandella subterranea]|uniref:Antitoxin PrlF n=1 Tax=Vreelandella subterranea TaxID=416874 RepID=A0A1H9RQL4_9GAMM|nr:type II toxin-antitoxin system PrlF family antitoxin [Halomonas subterranea]SER74884.1 antitoxin PrlF [Halomonas subterranea]